MRIILTEDQVEVIRLLNEQTDFTKKVKDAIKDVKDGANRLYNIISYTTIAEIRDGDTDISIIEQRVNKLDDLLKNINRRVSDYYDRYPEDLYKAKRLDDIHLELESRISIVNKKITALGYLVKQLLPFSKVGVFGEGRDMDWDNPFDDITPTEV